MKRYLIIIVFLVLTSLLVVGCVSYDQELSIQPDGSGEAYINYTVSNNPIEGLGTAATIPESFSTNEAEIRNMYKARGVKIRDLSINESGLETTVKIAIEFGNVLDLNEHGVWDENQVIGTRIENGELLFIQDITNPDAKTLTPEEIKAYEEFKFTYSLRMPNPITETNGLKSKDGYTAYWEYPLSIVVRSEHLQMHARCDAPDIYSSSGSGAAKGILGGLSLMTIAICCAVILVVIIVIIIIIAVKKRKKRDPIIPQAVHTEQTPPASEPTPEQAITQPTTKAQPVIETETVIEPETEKYKPQPDAPVPKSVPDDISAKPINEDSDDNKPEPITHTSEKPDAQVIIPDKKTEADDGKEEGELGDKERDDWHKNDGSFD